MTDKKNAISRLRFALDMYKYSVKHADEIAAQGKMDLRNCFRIMAFRAVSIITDNAFTQEQFTHMLKNHLDELISMTA